MSPHEKEVLALAAKVEQLQNESKKATQKTRQPIPSGNNNEGKDGDKKREKMKPRKPEWLFKNKPPKPDAVFKFCICVRFLCSSRGEVKCRGLFVKVNF